MLLNVVLIINFGLQYLSLKLDEQMYTLIMFFIPLYHYHRLRVHWDSCWASSWSWGIIQCQNQGLHGLFCQDFRWHQDENQEDQTHWGLDEGRVEGRDCHWGQARSFRDPPVECPRRHTGGPKQDKQRMWRVQQRLFSDCKSPPSSLVEGNVCSHDTYHISLT